MIKTRRLCMFNDKCMDCARQGVCISPTRLIHDKRRFVLSLNNRPQYTLETHQLFKEGIANHEKHQHGIPTIDQYGYMRFRKDLHKHKEIKLSELKVCSPEVAFHGIIDIVTIKYDENKDIYIKIDELKSNFSKKHFIQLAIYALILSKRTTRLIYEEPMKRKKANKRKLGHLFPAEIRNINIDGRIFLFNKEEKQPYMEIMSHNHFFEVSGSINKGILKKAKTYRELMERKVVELEDFKQCSDCNKEKCGWSYICLKTPLNTSHEKQVYMSNHKILLNKESILIKTKPKVIA